MSATLFIMRHGEAASGSPDAERELTERGRHDVARMAAWLATTLESMALPQPRIVASPYRRARQSAAIVAERLGVEVETLELITPDEPLEPVIDWLQDNVDEAPQLLVSHMPLVGALTSRLVDGDPRGNLAMSTAAVALLRAEVWAAGCADLLALRDPAGLTPE
jgi:phosphohistidine phosphatase SixA